MSNCSLLQGIFPTQGSNSGLLPWRWILYCLSHKESQMVLLEIPNVNNRCQGKGRSDWVVLTLVSICLCHGGHRIYTYRTHMPPETICYTVLFFWPHHLACGDLSSPTRDPTFAPWSRSRVLTTGPPGKSWSYVIRNPSISSGRSNMKSPHTCVYIHIYIYVCVCVCVCARIYIYIYIYIYIHTHIYMSESLCYTPEI